MRSHLSIVWVGVQEAKRLVQLVHFLRLGQPPPVELPEEFVDRNVLEVIKRPREVSAGVPILKHVRVCVYDHRISTLSALRSHILATPWTCRGDGYTVLIISSSTENESIFLLTLIFP